jgi:hypothetical protein
VNIKINPSGGWILYNWGLDLIQSVIDLHWAQQRGFLLEHASDVDHTDPASGQSRYGFNS